MKPITLLFLLITTSAFSQKTLFNEQKKYVAEGYDVVAYFENKAIKGNEKFKVIYHNASFLFSSKKNATTFSSNPKKYAPQYGGYCAYAIAIRGKKVKINPKTFEIRQGELYLFYNKGTTNTLELWLSKNPDELKANADSNWEKLVK